MSADEEIRREMKQVEAMTLEVFADVVAEAHRSIVEGSEITGAPGQPVGQYGPGYNPGKIGGTLKASYQAEFDTPTHAVIGTNLEYAQAIEDGVGPHGPLTLRSSVGGFNSVAHTIAGMPRIRDIVVKRRIGRSGLEGSGSGSAP